MDFFRRLVSSLFGTSGIVDERVDTDFERIDTHRRSYTGRVRQDWRGYSEEVSGASNKHVMVVVDETNEAKTALLWALSHVVHKLDVVTLLHVLPGRPRPARSKSKAKKRYVEGQKTLSLLKSLCSHHQPEVQVDLLVVEGEEGPAIVEEAQKLQASIVVLGQRKPWILSRLLGLDKDKLVDYCIENLECLTLAVRKKSKGTSGYLISSKWQKNFWLLA
ncbi:hypothetical protein O6H91_07G077700 [Diphasiastrum complanatum]|uniref:Uncharacterized protein n=2 Tax=Diphasiastrum complanatum TaxID=34168 RepID=A0ACC2D750_DIPCM|nr:hypothetical protein O6H91_07G077700 [Diphasiastrum complanatum]KAJ7549999.1 hypothetical protein O6H91_07G077700 [Diphasiastrum complanatum]